MKKTIIATTLLAMISFGVPHTVEAETDKVKTQIYEFKEEVTQKKMNIVGEGKTKVDFLNTKKLNIGERLEKRIIKDIKEEVKFRANNGMFKFYKEEYGNDSRVKIIYDVKANNEKVLSIKATMYYVDEKGQSRWREGNFNLNYDKKKNEKIDIENLYKNEKSKEKVEAILKKKTKEKFGISLGFPYYSVNPYYIRQDGDVMISYNGNEIGSKWNEYGYVKISNKYFKK